MTPESRIHNRVYDLVKRGQNHQVTEDDNVELKSVWPHGDDLVRAVRQIAGCCNAVRGGDFYLLIGVQENTFQVIGAKDDEVSDWWKAARVMFYGIVPRFTTNAVPFPGDKSVVALVFDTSSPPYMVHNTWLNKPGQKGDIWYEIPWRQANGGRSATREEILSLLCSFESTPESEIVGCVLTYDSTRSAGIFLSLELVVYLVPRNERRIVIPFNHCEVVVTAANAAPISFGVDYIRQYARAREKMFEFVASATIEDSESEVIVKGPGTVRLVAIAPNVALPTDSDVDFYVKMKAVHTSHAIVCADTLRPGTAPNGVLFWAR
jgi:hypothetical protein